MTRDTDSERNIREVLLRDLKKDARQLVGRVVLRYWPLEQIEVYP